MWTFSHFNEHSQTVIPYSVHQLISTHPHAHSSLHEVATILVSQLAIQVSCSILPQSIHQSIKLNVWRTQPQTASPCLMMAVLPSLSFPSCKRLATAFCSLADLCRPLLHSFLCSAYLCDVSRDALGAGLIPSTGRTRAEAEAEAEAEDRVDRTIIESSTAVAGERERERARLRSITAHLDTLPASLMIPYCSCPSLL